jgi:flagellin
VSFSINTNIASLQAQNYLRADSNFQNATINQVTSGLRIVNSGDDAAGLAIANGLRSDQAVLTQGIRNANDGLSTLQTIDGGMSNISQLLDRATTLATQSASSTFTGDRGVLSSEFQSVMSEINRQSQSIGLNSGGQFAKDLSVFIGGGQASGSTNAIQNGSVAVDLTHATVDTQSLGLSGFSVTGNSSVDVGTGGGTTTVANILANNINQGSEAQSGYTVFNVAGPGFSDDSGNNRVAVSVNLSGVTDVNSLATAINAGIQSAGNGTSQQATAFKNANVQASVYTDANGASHLRFTSSTAAFQVEAGDNMANALMGNVTVSGTSPTAQGQSVGVATVTTNVNPLAGYNSINALTPENNIKLQITNGATVSVKSLSIGANDTSATIINNLNTALAGTGVTAALDSNSKLYFSSANSSSLQVGISGDDNNYLGQGTFKEDAGGNYNYTNITAGAIATQAGGANTIQIAVGNQTASMNLNFAGGASNLAAENAALATLNTAFQSNALASSAGLVAVDNAGSVEVKSTNGTIFRLNSEGATAASGFSVAAATAGYAGTGSVNSFASLAATTTAGTGMNGTDASDFTANGTSTSGFLNFQGISIGDARQTITLTAPDAAGANHAISFSLTAANAGTVDQALSYINQQLLQSNDPTLQSIVGVKDQGTGTYNATTNPNGNGATAGTDGLRFVSSLANFTVSVGGTSAGTGLVSGQTTPNPTTLTQGIYTTGTVGGNSVTIQGGAMINSSQNGAGATADISSQTNAENAVSAITKAVTALGSAQAAVGKGENNFNYAINLAQSQVTNEAAAESRIRDADLAAEAANLSKAQILVQAGTAALAQANSAPQAILTLLRQ